MLTRGVKRGSSDKLNNGDQFDTMFHSPTVDNVADASNDVTGAGGMELVSWLLASDVEDGADGADESKSGT